MSDYTPDTGPVIPSGPAPEHGPNFWAELESTMISEAPRSSETSQIPAALYAASPATSVRTVSTGSPIEPRREPGWSQRQLVPLAAAAALAVLVGLAFVVANRSADPATTTEIVAAPTALADVAPLDGPDDGADGADGVEAAASDETTDDNTTAPTAPTAPAAPTATADDTTNTTDNAAPTATAGSSASAGEGTNSSGSGAGGDESNGATSAPLPTAAPIPDFAHAFGSIGDPAFLPLDQGVPAAGTFLANWPERAVTYYAVNDSDRNCASAEYSEMRYVNGSGLTQAVRDPQLRFSGEISHFTVRTEQDVAAWIVSCGTQLELYVANLEPTGRIVDMTLAWFGEGSVESALMQWDADEVSFNAIEPGASAFAVAYNLDTKLLSRNGGPSRIMLEAGAPAERSLTPLAATADAGLTYWAGKADPGTESACLELYGSGQSDMLWLRQGEGMWQPAAAGDFPIGTVTAAAIEPEFLQFAFADWCPGQAGRVSVGTQLPDGRIGDIHTIDLTPYVPGYATQLFWVDADTLRIETDNTDYNFGTVRFDYRLDEGVMVLLD